MEAAAEGVQDRLVKNSISLDIRAPANIGSFVADERRLRQFFSISFPTQSVSRPRRNGHSRGGTASDAVYFKVSDRGPGIPPEAMDKVFDWFETNSMGSQHRGPGLGLSLVRSFVELHGGTVTINSVSGKGTTVTCTFPVAQVAKQTAA